MAGSNATKPIGAPVVQFSVFLQNRAGALESLIQLLHGAQVEMLGLSVQDSRDSTVARIVTSDPEIAQQVFIEKGIAHTTSELLVVALRDVGVELGKCLRELRLAETNIDFGYSLFPHPNGQTLVAFHVEDHEFGQSVLHHAGLKIVTQDDLSR